MARSKSTIREVEDSTVDVSFVPRGNKVQMIITPSESEPFATENNHMQELTVSRKVKKVEYQVTFPDPKVTALSDEQKAIAVQSFFTARVGYLLRQAVATETDSIQAFVKAHDSMLNFAKAFPTYDGDEAKARKFVLAHLKSTIPDFRLEPAKGYSFGLDKIFEPPKPDEVADEDTDESEEK